MGLEMLTYMPAYTALTEGEHNFTKAKEDRSPGDIGGDLVSFDSPFESLFYPIIKTFMFR